MKSFLTKILIRNKSKLFIRFNAFLGFVTIVSVLAVTLQTVSSLSVYEDFFYTLEMIVVTIFTFEFLGRLYVKKDRSEYLFSIFGLVDIMSILPSYLGVSNLTFIKSARIIRVLYFLRLTRMAKLARMNKYSNRNSNHVKQIQALSIRIYGIVLAASVFLFGSLLYVVESSNSNYQDIPSGVIWATLVMLGGSVNSEELSLAGKMIVICLHFCSLLLFGLLINIVGRFVQNKLLGSNTLVK